MGFLKAANANPYEDHPDAKHKVIQRSNYLKLLFQDKDLGGWGNFKSDEPDSYIFRGDAIQQSGLRPLHTYRVIVPSLIGQTKKAASQFKGPPNPIRKPKWHTVKSVHPDGKGLNLMVKVLSSTPVTEAKGTAWEVVVGD